MKYFLNIVVALLLSQPVFAQNNWTGAISTDWNNPDNWSSTLLPIVHLVPTILDDVIIPSAPSNQPVVYASGLLTAVAKSVEVKSGATLTINATGTLAINGSKSVVSILTSFYNKGTLTNNGELFIGNIAILPIGNYGIRSGGIVNNNLGAKITVDNLVAGGIGIYQESTGQLTNAGTIAIGAVATTGNIGIDNFGSATNSSTGEISVDNAVRTTTAAGIGMLMESNTTFNNYGKITIGAIPNTGADNGIRTNGTSIFNNNAGGEIIIDRTATAAILNAGTSRFTNMAKITLGGLPITGTSVGRGINVFGSGAQFNNSRGGEIKIDQFQATGIENIGTFMNTAKITIGATEGGGSNGMLNSTTGTITNDSLGEISIDRSIGSGVLNRTGSTFTNKAKITIGAVAAVGNSGIANNGATFNNNRTGEINIDRVANVSGTPGAGLRNVTGGSFTNANKITIGGVAAVGDYGLLNQDATFNNTSGADIKIDRSAVSGLYNYTTGAPGTVAAIFNNTAARITIGGIAGVGTNGLSNDATFNNNECGQVIVHRGNLQNNSGRTYTNAGLTLVFNTLNNAGTFTNTGVLKYKTLVNTGTLNNSTISSVIVNDHPATPVFTYGLDPYDGTIVGIYTDTATSVSAGDFEAPNTFTPTLTPGLHKLYAKIIPAGGCTFIVPFIYNIEPLPVTLVSFSGAKTSINQNTLKWVTSDEKNLSNFDIQRSTDGRIFQTIGSINPPAESSATLSVYQFVDKDVTGANYYRLKMVDMDGTFDYSRIIYIQNAVSEEPFAGQFYPNPASGMAMVDLYAARPGTWNITTLDVSGKVIQTQGVNLSGGTNQITLKQLADGLNVVRIENDETTIIRKVFNVK